MQHRSCDQCHYWRATKNNIGKEVRDAVGECILAGSGASLLFHLQGHGQPSLKTMPQFYCAEFVSADAQPGKAANHTQEPTEATFEAFFSGPANLHLPIGVYKVKKGRLMSNTFIVTEGLHRGATLVGPAQCPECREPLGQCKTTCNRWTDKVNNSPVRLLPEAELVMRTMRPEDVLEAVTTWKEQHK